MADHHRWHPPFFFRREESLRFQLPILKNHIIWNRAKIAAIEDVDANRNMKLSPCNKQNILKFVVFKQQKH
jgi:hypothetical protein